MADVAHIALKLYAGGRKNELDVLELLDRSPTLDREKLETVCKELGLEPELRKQSPDTRCRPKSKSGHATSLRGGPNGGMVDAISSSNRRPIDDDHHTNAPTSATRYVELDVDAIRTTPFVCADAPLKTTLFVDGISSSDVQQGQVGDCTLQASLASLARTLGGRRFLENNVRANVDGAGNVTSYTATLYKKNAAGAYVRTAVTVPANCFASYGAVHAMDGTGVEVWPRVYEAAMLKLNGGQPCSNMPEAMGILTGRPASDVSTSDAELADKLERGFRHGQVQVLSTTGKVTTPMSEPKLKPAHAYTLAAIEVRAIPQADGSFNVERVYVLRNPWGYDHPRALTLDEVKKYFSTYSEGNVPS